MALKSTVFKADINVADMNRDVYGDYSLTLARHPSETTERMMLRLLAFACHASEDLEFGRGLSTEDEPDLWQRDLTGEIELWVDLGTPDPERIRKACGRSRQVVVYCYGQRAVPVWWAKHETRLARFENLRIFVLEPGALADLAQPSMRMQCSIEGRDIWINSGDSAAQLAWEVLKA